MNPPPTGLDPKFDTDAAPRVGGNPSLWPIVAGMLGAAALGTIVFLQLNGNRQRVEEARLTDPVAAAPISTQGVPPPPDMTAFQSPTPEPVYVPPLPAPVDLAPPPPAPPAPPPGPTQAEIDRLRAPALIIDLGEFRAANAAQTTGGTTTPGTTTPGAGVDPRAVTNALGGAANAGQLNSDERFAQRMGLGENADPARARAIGNLTTTVLEGSIIPAVLETALNSDLPGYVRAVVSRDVRGYDGKEVLIPRGARLIGQYRNGVALGQKRAFVIWTRLIRPDGAAIELTSPATDALGRGGLSGSVDTHFLQRFGGAILLSLVNIGVAAATSGADTAIIVAGARTGDAATASIGQDQNIAPTVTVPQGSPVRVFVSQDLDFSSVGPARPVTGQ
jgi:type IV secretion system protein VirB10